MRSAEYEENRKTFRLARLALFTAAALILYIIELQLPGPIPIPGVKLGIANIVTVAAVYYFSPKETGMMVAARILLGTLFGGSFSALIFSASGAALCLCGMLLLKRALALRYIWLCSIFGALLHNVGQIGAAMFVMRNVGAAVYLPILLVSGCISGLFTGLCAQLVTGRLSGRNGMWNIKE